MKINDQKRTDVATRLGSIKGQLDTGSVNPIDATAWFLGPKAENEAALLELVSHAIESHSETRRKYMQDDPGIFDKDHPPEHSIDIIKKELSILLTQLSSSIPLASYRNQSHMYWDITLPGVVGYFAAMLYNQNNVAAEASPVTTVLEIQVGKDLCKMLGFNPGDDENSKDSNTEHEGNKKAITGWGHITCDGSIANGESMWAARNLKFLPIALAAAVANEPDLIAAKCVSVETCAGNRHRLIDASLWELLNLPIDVVIGLVETIERETGIDPSIIRNAVDQYSAQNIGLVQFQQRYLDTYEQATPVVLVPATAHYSWPKTAALIGLGTTAVKLIEVDLDGRMSLLALRRELCRCLAAGRPVLQVVAVLGTTEEGALDPLADIVALRKEYQALGLNFVIHVDAAWGGYFTSILRDPLKPPGNDLAEIIDQFPELYLNHYFKQQFNAIAEADSVTLDPHKSGFIPYPAGSLCYRNGAMRDLIAYTAPVVFHGGLDVTVGPYGIEGSKPGAAAASVYLSHKVIPLDKTGYGRMLGRCLFNSKRFYAALVTMDLPNSGQDEDLFTITAFQRLPVEREPHEKADIIQQKQYIHENFVHCETPSLITEVLGLGQPKPNEKQKEALQLFQAIGSDLSIISYAFNLKINGSVNTDLVLMNELNDGIFRKLSLQPNEGGKIPEVKLFVTSSAFDPGAYGQTLVDDFAARAGVTTTDDTAMTFLISTTQNPWLSSTFEKGNMINDLIDVLRTTVNDTAKEVIANNHLQE